ncbi:class I adenylate-forming enzyme family protein [Arenibaculum sp.]|uniref:class I adenylate-forming enzyme family protein n=1 Tax=Arenibaculum sp. TaxID=2865862 RepID=UPI002E12A65E|nr:class I adenylate-forming enzyme family protein [Arenibaculum sp.]
MTPSARLGDVLLDACARTPAHPAVVAGGDAWTYARLAEAVRHVGEDLRLRLDGTRCMFVPEPLPSSVATLFALFRAGKVPFIADPTWPAAVLLDICGTFGCRTVVAGSGHSFSEPLPGRQPVRDDRRSPPFAWTLPWIADGGALHPSTAFVRFSSGSTGRPRALEFSASAALEAAGTWRAAAAISERDRILCLATLNNGLAFNTSLLSALLAGATLHLHAGLPTPGAIVRNALQVLPTILVGFPFILELLLGQGEKLRRSLGEARLVVSSAAPLPADVATRWQDVTGLPIGHYYGIAETGPVTFNDGRTPGSSGTPLPGTRIRASGREGSPGPIAVRTRYQATAYVDDGGPPLTDAADAEGYFLTSDLGHLAADGGLRIVGRAGRVANLAGNKFSLDAVEAAIGSLPGIEGVHVQIRDGVMTAYVHGPGIPVDAVRAHCLRVLPPLQVPHRIRQVPHLPRSAAGKISVASLELLSERPNRTTYSTGEET